MHQAGHQGNQCIHCTVHSCKHHHTPKDLCKLASINVCPTPQGNSGEIDESMCGSYEN